MSFFDSRWVKQPDSVSETKGLPSGFRAAGVAAGIKPSGTLDLGVVVSDLPGTVGAARFTASGIQAAPVVVSKERCDLTALRAVIANSGNANAATGAEGFAVALQMQAALATELSVEPKQVAVASTGVIGVPLAIDPIAAATPEAVAALSSDGDTDFVAAISTTDAFEKRASLIVELPDGSSVRLSGQAKGAGMINPRFATMLCFIETDAKLTAQQLDLLLGATVDRSFVLVSVDGQLSTNDTVIALANGASGVEIEPESEAEVVFAEALEALLRQLAILVVRDGEGAKRIARVTVHGGNDDSVACVAEAVANSPLVKAALHGGDPNWGRIVQAVGMALPETAPLPVDVWIEGVQVCMAGSVLPYDKTELEKAVAGSEVDYTVGLPGSGSSTERYFSDLSYRYVEINAEYTT